jgi:uncharacterized protein DUF3857
MHLGLCEWWLCAPEEEELIMLIVERARQFALMVLLVVATLPPIAQEEDWLPVTSDELKMVSEPNAPGAPAIYLYRQVDRDDNSSQEYDYARIKILTEEGRKYADVEIPFVKGVENIRDIHARTIRPDGSTVNFDGKIYEKTIVKAKGLSFLAKTFSLPDVQVGSIIEYRYHDNRDSGRVFDSHWILSEELFTKRAVFTLRPYNLFSLRWGWSLPEGTTPPLDSKGTIRLETQNVPAFKIEDYMPPEDELKYRVDFVYNIDPSPEKDPDKFWKQAGKNLYSGVNRFIDKRGAMEAAVAGTILPGDSPQEKLRKIYARTQQIHNTSFEPEKTEQELKRENLKDINNVEDLWKHGYGDGVQITWLFLAMARAAGFQADPVLVSSRNVYFFNPRYMDRSQLNANVVLVNLNGEDMYFDPGHAFAPFGMLPWYETDVQGLRLDKEGGTWVRTALPAASASRVERKADLQLAPETGSLEGKVTITFTGLEALWRRTEERNQDDVGRKAFLEDEMKDSIPASAEAELTNHPDWSSSEAPLVAEYQLKVPGWLSYAGRRGLLSIGLFTASEKHLFEHADRVHPIYFQFPYQDVDDITIHLPSGWQVSSLPAAKDVDSKVCTYTLNADNKEGALHVRRQLNISLLLVDSKYYSALRDFFQLVRTGDEQQIVVSREVHVAQN